MGITNTIETNIFARLVGLEWYGEQILSLDWALHDLSRHSLPLLQCLNSLIAEAGGSLNSPAITGPPQPALLPNHIFINGQQFFIGHPLPIEGVGPPVDEIKNQNGLGVFKEVEKRGRCFYPEYQPMLRLKAQFLADTSGMTPFGLRKLLDLLRGSQRVFSWFIHEADGNYLLTECYVMLKNQNSRMYKAFWEKRHVTFKICDG